MYDILFVDDDVATAREYAELVGNFTKLRPYVCSSKDEALAIARDYPIAVAVLDQKMPEILGTELFDELSQILPRMRAIMLSGEADPDEIGQAVNLGYKRYLHKSDLRKLPAIALSEFARYQTDLSRSIDFEPIQLCSVKSWFGLRGTVEFWLVAIFVEDEAYIPDEMWELIDQINRGEKKTIMERFEISSELKFEENVESTLSSNIDIGVKAGAVIKTKMDSVLKYKINTGSSIKKTKIKETVRELALLEQQEGRKRSEAVRSRCFYWAPVFRKIQCHIVKKITPVNERLSVSLSTLQPTGKIATKQVDYLEDGGVNVHLTGSHTL